LEYYSQSAKPLSKKAAERGWQKDYEEAIFAEQFSTIKDMRKLS